MRYLKCKCGACERWDSGEAVAPCSGCKKCGTTFATHPDDHKPLQPHEWEPRYDPLTGKPERRMCARCHKIERVGADTAA